MLRLGALQLLQQSSTREERKEVRTRREVQVKVSERKSVQVRANREVRRSERTGGPDQATLLTGTMLAHQSEREE